MTVLVSSISAMFVSCNSDVTSESSSGNLGSEHEMLKYAEDHNSGLDFFKQQAENNTYVFPQNHLDSLFKEWVMCQYGKERANEISQHIFSVEETALNGDFPSLAKTRSMGGTAFGGDVNSLSLDALEDCMRSISNEFEKYKESAIFDNIALLEKLHSIIGNTYLAYSEKCISDVEKKGIMITLGVLYGSIEYWTNSDNVDAWSRMQLITNDGSPSNVASITSKRIVKSKEVKKNDGRTLPKSEWVQTVCAADAAGAAIAGPEAGLAASAAAALYFDVE